MATTDDGRKLERAAKLLVTLRELQAKTYELTGELVKIVAGDQALGDLLPRAMAAFDRAWSARYPGHYVWNYAKDGAQMKRLLRAIPIDDLEARFLVYMQNADPFFTKNRHTFGLFVASVNQHAAEGDHALALTAPCVADCRHTPHCQSDQAHTARTMRELRA